MSSNLPRTLKGYEIVRAKHIDGNNVYDKFSETISNAVITNLANDTRLDVTLSSLQTQITNIASGTLPDQTGNNGKFLKTDGVGTSWASVDALPTQTNNNGRYLQTNGSTPSWVSIAIPTLTSTIVPIADGIASYGSSTEAARADHVHPFSINFKETNIVATGGETQITLTAEQWPNGTFFGTSVYRNGLLMTSGIDYTLNSTNKTITFSQACNASENIVVILGTLIGNTSSGLQAVLTEDEVPVMDGIAEIGSSTKAARANHKHPSDNTKANITSPSFDGIPIVPTAAVNTNTSQIASTAFVINQIATTTIPTQTANSGKILSTNGTNTLWVEKYPETTSASVGQVLGLDTNKDVTWISMPNELPSTTSATSGQVLALDSNKNYIWKSITESVTFPEQTVADAGKILSTNGNTLQWIDRLKLTSTVTPSISSASSFIGVSTEGARADHSHKSDDSKANLDSPVFTGIPIAPTPASSTNNTQIATTAFVSNYVNDVASANFIVNNSDTLYNFKNITEATQDLGMLSADTTIDFANGNIVKATIDNDIALAFSITSASTSNCRTITLYLTNANNHAVSWPNTIHWNNNTVPTLTSVISIITLVTLDNGNSYYGSLFGNFV